MPKLIVMMAAKNAEQYIVKALSTCLTSLPSDSEIVVWNDGSSDNTLGQIASIRDKRIRVYDSKISLGSGAARSKIMSLTDSEYIACLDADDLCLPWRFRVQLDHVKNYDVSFMNSVKFGPSKTSIRPSLSLPYNATEVNSSLLFHNPIVHSTFFARRSIVERIGGYRDLKVAQDYDLWLRLAVSGAKMGIMARPGIAYRKNSGQISGRPNYVAHIRSQEILVEAYNELLTNTWGHLSGLESDETPATLSDIEVAEGGLEGILKGFRPALRCYYKSIWRRGRLGPLTLPNDKI